MTSYKVRKMSAEEFNEKIVKRILKLLMRFDKLNGPEISDITNLSPEEINDGIHYLRKMDAIKTKGKASPYLFKDVIITKEGKRLYNVKFLEGQFEI
jgi:hypothetical protein